MALSNSQLDKLGDRLRTDGPINDADRLAYDEYRASFTDALAEVQERIRSIIHPAEDLTSRRKTLESVRGKLSRSTVKLFQMDDIAGARVVVWSLAEQDEALASIQGEFPTGRVKDKRLQPTLGYRSVHIIVRSARPPGRNPAEILNSKHMGKHLRGPQPIHWNWHQIWTGARLGATWAHRVILRLGRPGN